MKTYTTEITQGTADNIINFLSNKGYDMEILVGCLNDGFIAEIGNNNFSLGKIKLRKFIIVVEQYINEWTSALKMILTDDESVYNKYYDIALQAIEN